MVINHDDPGRGIVETFQFYRQGHDSATGVLDEVQIADVLNVEDIGAEEFEVMASPSEVKEGNAIWTI